jgi:two-component system, OmpR family, sensor histidine kinase KdpD
MARGKLRIYLGAAPGVGKTYAMLDEGWRRRCRGTDVVVGFVETHGRPKTAAQLRDLEVVPRRTLTYKGQSFEEMDLDAILARRPQEALVDEMAHTNVPGSPNEKRWQDVHCLLDAGIDVISTLNIHHLASLNDVVENITGVSQRETVPDSVVRAADQIELVDMSPEALRRRMAHGNIYPAEKVDVALSHYFRVGNLGALRELALLWVAEQVDDQLAAYRKRHGIDQRWETRERVVVALDGQPGSEYLLRRGHRIAARVNGEMIGVHVRATEGLSRVPPALESQRRLIGELGGRYAEVTDSDVAHALVTFARAENATQLVLGASSRSGWAQLVQGSIINRAIGKAGPMEVHVIPVPNPPAGAGLPPLPRRHRPAVVSPRRRLAGWLLGTIGIILIGFSLAPFRPSLGLPVALLCLLLGVVGVATVGGVQPAATATVISALMADFFFTTPYYTFRMDQPLQILALAVFLAVAAAVSALVDRLARRGMQVTRASAEAVALASLAGRAVLSEAEALPDLVAELRRTFALDAVAVLTPDGDGWRPAAAAGGPVPSSPSDAPFTAELDQGAALVMTGATLKAEDSRLLAAFVAQLRLAQRRINLEREAASAGELRETDTLRAAILSAVSHDLRTPLASIKAAATSVLSDEVDWTPDDMRGFCKTINAEADRLTGLVDNLLDMSRLQAGSLPVSLRPTALENVLYASVASLSSRGSGIVIEADALPPAQADAGLLERAVANVMANAQTWSPPGTVVRVEAGVAGDHIDVRVIDQGPGIPPDQRDEIFRPFQRLGDRTAGKNGLGLGLAVARGFIAAMGGELDVEDTPGGGATFVCRLRRADP